MAFGRMSGDNEESFSSWYWPKERSFKSLPLGTEGESSASAAIYDPSGATGMLDLSAVLSKESLNGLYALPLESKRGTGENESCKVLVSSDPSILSLRD